MPTVKLPYPMTFLVHQRYWLRAQSGDPFAMGLSLVGLCTPPFPPTRLGALGVVSIAAGDARAGYPRMSLAHSADNASSTGLGYVPLEA